LSATASGVPANVIVGASLAIVPKQNFALLGQYSSDGYNGAITSYPINAVDEAPAVFGLLAQPANQYTQSYSQGSLSVSPSGGFAFTSYSYTGGAPGCIVSFVSATGVLSSNPLALNSTSQSYNCSTALSFDGAGEMIVPDQVAGAVVLHVFAQGASGGAFTSVRTIALTDTQTPISALAVDPTGNIGVLQGSNVLKFAANASGNVAPIATYPVSGGTDLAFGPDGSFELLQPASSFGSPSTFQVQTYSSSGTPGRLFQYSVNANAFFPGLAVDAANETLVSTQFFSGPNLGNPSGALVYFFPSSASGNAQPTRTFGGALTRLSGVYAGPRIAPATTPQIATVTGDMLALAPSRGWTYTAKDEFGDPPFTVTVYNDPHTSNNVSTLVAFVAQGTPATALAGTNAGALGVTSLADGYRASSYVSVSNNASGTIPGAPLLVPNSLQRGQSWQPLASLALPGIPAVSANVVSVGAVPGLSACPNSPTTGATVQYSVGGSISVVSYVPGCGITDYVNDAGTEFTLTSVASYPQVGQLDIARRAESATIMGTLRTLWQRVLVRHSN